MPYFNYCVAVWGNINKGLAYKLQKLQNRAARILTFSNYDVRSSVLLDELGCERLEYVRRKQLAVTMYKIHNYLSPSYLRRIFTNTSNVHSHNLRNSELNYYVPRPRTESAKAVADLGEGPGSPPPVILGKKRRNDGRKNGRQGKYPPPPPPLSSRSGSATEKGAYTTEDLFCVTRFPLHSLNVFKTSFQGKDFSSTA